MIESCTKKRVLFFIVASVGLALLVLGVDTFLDGGEKSWPSTSTGEPYTNDAACSLSNESLKIMKECQLCSSFEMNIKLSACLPTGYKELVRCGQNDVWRSCERSPWLEKRSFWIFISVAFVLGISSGLVTYGRQRQLNRKTLDRIQKQISAGV